MATSHSNISSPKSPETSSSKSEPPALSASPIRSMSFGVALTSCEPASSTTGRIPLPSFPVDSAINCSTQSPKPTISEPAGTKPSLSLKPRPLAARAIAAPRTRPGLVGSSRPRASVAAIALFKIDSVSTPASIVGTTPKAVRPEYLPPTVGSARKTR